MASGSLSIAVKHRVFIVDDHPVVREGLRAIISAQDDLTVCGEAATLAEALQFVRHSSVDIVLFDLSLQDCHGLTGLGQLLRRAPRTRVLILSCSDEKLYAERALHAGAMGYVQKCEQSEHILEAIRRVLRGELYASRCIVNRLFGRFGHRPRVESMLARLSDRELEVFELLGQGLISKQIARRLFVSVKTVESHREQIKKKLGLSTSAELSFCAMRWVLEAAETAQSDLSSTGGTDVPH